MRIFPFLTRRHPGSPAFQKHIDRADRARAARHWTLARDGYRAALDHNPRLAGIWVQYGHALKHTGNLGSAETAYLRSIELDPKVADTHLQLGHVFKLQGRVEEAAAAYLRALLLDVSLQFARDELRSLGWTDDQLAYFLAPRQAAQNPLPKHLYYGFLAPSVPNVHFARPEFIFDLKSVEAQPALAALPKRYFEQMQVSDALLYVPLGLLSECLFNWAELLAYTGTLRIEAPSLIAVAYQMQQRRNFQYHRLALSRAGRLQSFSDVVLHTHLLAVGFQEVAVTYRSETDLFVEASRPINVPGYCGGFGEISDHEWVKLAYQDVLGECPDDSVISYYADILSSNVRVKTDLVREWLISEQRLEMISRRFNYDR
jgi:tetratricopeptide (TPR) repeat protein